MSEGEAAERGPLTIGRLPLAGEPLPLDLVNTTYIRGGVRGRLIDALSGPPDLDAWLTAQRARFSAPVADGLSETAPADPALLADFLELRRALRALAGACTSGDPAAPGDVGALNSWASRGTSWQELAQRGPAQQERAGQEPAPQKPAPHGRFLAVCRRSESDPRRAALAQIAAEAVTLLSGTAAELLRACPAPGCVLYFVRSHPRREWCTAACGNRVRVARHSRRDRTAAE